MSKWTNISLIVFEKLFIYYGYIRMVLDISLNAEIAAIAKSLFAKCMVFLSITSI